MDTSLVYNIPAKMIDTYRGRNVIVRSSSPTEIVDYLARSDWSTIRFIQLLSADMDPAELEGTGQNIPIDILLNDPARYQNLYNFTNLLDSHPVRVTVPVVRGFSKAVKLAASLQFAIKLELDQPDEVLLRELEAVVDFYLHSSQVRHPIEFLQTMILSLYRDEQVSLWEIMEEDPELVRYISDDGVETISRRFGVMNSGVPLEDFVNQFCKDLLGEKRECYECKFFDRCNGYFKWPDQTYSCAGIKRIFQTLETAVHEVRQDLDSFEAMGVSSQS